MAVAEPTLDVETDFWRAGATTIIGCDEVGRGAIAGPVSVGLATVTVECGAFPPGLRDSKLLAQPKRESLIPGIASWVTSWAIGESSADEIDDGGIVPALGRAATRALERIVDSGIDLSTALILLDGKHDWLTPALGDRAGDVRVITRIKADRDCASVAAASVLAKVGRDGLMMRHHVDYEDYGWHSNKGYGSAVHYAAIDRIGPSPLHRVTWLSTPAERALSHEPAPASA
ncbi:ribonuclease HII [Microbacteriaceae bacterium VKM Ac-2855]|nr:ribonuclease HII [Microbacteriaceae bacterium VKM Ac-2855]